MILYFFVLFMFILSLKLAFRTKSYRPIKYMYWLTILYCHFGVYFVAFGSVFGQNQMQHFLKYSLFSSDQNQTLPGRRNICAIVLFLKQWIRADQNNGKTIWCLIPVPFIFLSVVWNLFSRNRIKKNISLTQHKIDLLHYFI